MKPFPQATCFENLEPTEVQNEVQLKTSGYVIYWRGEGELPGGLAPPPRFYRYRNPISATVC